MNNILLLVIWYIKCMEDAEPSSYTDESLQVDPSSQALKTDYPEEYKDYPPDEGEIHSSATLESYDADHLILSLKKNGTEPGDRENILIHGLWYSHKTFDLPISHMFLEKTFCQEIIDYEYFKHASTTDLFESPTHYCQVAVDLYNQVYDKYDAILKAINQTESHFLKDKRTDKTTDQVNPDIRFHFSLDLKPMKVNVVEMAEYDPHMSIIPKINENVVKGSLGIYKNTWSFLLPETSLPAFVESTHTKIVKHATFRELRQHVFDIYNSHIVPLNRSDVTVRPWDEVKEEMIKIYAERYVKEKLNVKFGAKNVNNFIKTNKEEFENRVIKRMEASRETFEEQAINDRKMLFRSAIRNNLSYEPHLSAIADFVNQKFNNLLYSDHDQALSFLKTFYESGGKIDNILKGRYMLSRNILPGGPIRYSGGPPELNRISRQLVCRPGTIYASQCVKVEFTRLSSTQVHVNYKQNYNDLILDNVEIKESEESNKLVKKLYEMGMENLSKLYLIHGLYTPFEKCERPKDCRQNFHDFLKFLEKIIPRASELEEVVNLESGQRATVLIMMNDDKLDYSIDNESLKKH